MRAASWRAALRIARRDAWRAKGRSLLVIALIGLPVFVLSGADIAYRTWQLSPAEKVTREIGAADAAIQWGGGGAVKQTPGAWLDGNVFAEGTDPHKPQPPEPSTATIRAALPGGTRVVERLEAGEVQLQTSAGLASTSLVGLDYADPIAHGLLRQVSGRAPRTVHEVALTSTLARSAGLHVGDTMRLTRPVGRLRVVGVVADAGHRHAECAYVLPAAVPSGHVVTRTWLVGTTRPVRWTQVRQLNAAGLSVLSRSAYLHRPPAAQIPDLGQGGSSGSTSLIATASLVAGMALLEIVLLAGPAFAVSARRQRRDLALVAAVGGRRADLRDIVLAGGIVLGSAAAVISVAAGLLAAAIGIPLLGRLVDSVPGGFDVRPPDLGALAALSVLTALAAALFPARGAARIDVVAALAGRRGVVAGRRHVPVIGIALAGAGVAVSLGAVTASTGATVILAGVALVELGLIMCTPALLGATARLGRRLPLAPRMALRDTGRNRSAAAPAVAAVMAAVIGAIAIMIGLASTTDQDRRGYFALLPHHDWVVGLSADTAARSADVTAALRAELPTARIATISAPSSCDPQGRAPCRSQPIAVEETDSDQRTPSRYHGGFLPDILIDDGSHVDALFGTAVPKARAALAAGRAVAVDAALVRNGTVGVTVGGATTRTVQVPTTAVPEGFAPARIILPPKVAAALGITPGPVGVLAEPPDGTPGRVQQAVAQRLAKIDAGLDVYAERGFHDPNAWLAFALAGAAGLIAVAAAIIATALANLDSRTDLVTLGAVGASPRTRRLLSMARAGVIATVGTVVGVAAGFVPPAAWVHAAHRAAALSHSGAGFYYAGPPAVGLRLVVPWLPVTTALLGIPLLAALVAGAFTRSRLPSERPAE